MWIRSRVNDINTLAINTDIVGRISISYAKYKGENRDSVCFTTNSEVETHIVYDTLEHAKKAYTEIMDAIIRGENCMFSPADGYLTWRYL